MNHGHARREFNNIILITIPELYYYTRRYDLYLYTRTIRPYDQWSRGSFKRYINGSQQGFKHISIVHSKQHKKHSIRKRNRPLRQHEGKYNTSYLIR